MSKDYEYKNGMLVLKPEADVKNKLQKNTKEALKNKPFKNLSTGEKDLLLETMAKMLHLIN